MESRWFWNNWIREYRLIWYVLCFMLLVALGSLAWYQYQGADAAIHWDKLHDQKTVETVSHSFDVGSFEFAIPIESFVTYEFFYGSTMALNEFAAWSFLIILIAAALILLTVVTTFGRFWYLVGTGLFILFLVSLRLDVLRLFGFFNQWTTVVAILLYGGISFYFHAFRTAASFSTRLITFLIITTAVAGVIAYGATVEYPFLHLWVTGYTPALVLTVLFILLIAHEIPATFIYLVSQGTSSSKSLRHFSIISVIYFANLIILYMHEIGMIDWNFIYINVYLLFALSGVLTIAGYKNREPLYGNVMPFDPFGAYFITALAAVAFITTANLLANANDAGLKVIYDLIIFSHIGLGIIFLTYVFSNFILMLAENYQVYKVLYKPNRMPFVTFRIAGFIAVLGFIFYSNWRDYAYHSLSGFYNNLGDLYQKLEKPTLAEAYYEQGKTYGFRNHHSNYAIADMRAREGDLEKAVTYYEYANTKRPTPYSLANYGNLFMIRGQVFDAIKSYAGSLRRMPDSGPLENNLGYAYAKVHNLDSALYLFGEARNHRLSKATAEINFAAFLSQEFLPVKADSLQSLFESTPLLRSNLLSIATIHQQSFAIDTDVLASRTLDLFTATQLNNYLVNKLHTLDSAFLRQAFEIVNDSVNLSYRESLKLTMAHAFYHNNNVRKALELMGELAYLSQLDQGEYNYIAGLWALEQGDPELAISYFSYAEMQDYKKARAYNTIALAEAHYTDAARSGASLLLGSDSEENKTVGKLMQEILSLEPQSLQTDDQRYQYFRYHLSVHDTVRFNTLIQPIQNPNVKAQALLEMAERQFRYGNTRAAIRYFRDVSGLQLTDKALYERIRYLELRMLAYRGELRTLADQINNGVTFDRKHELDKMLYAALLHEASGDTAQATKHYEIVGTYNPFFEEGILGAARYFQAQDPTSFKAYNMITDALHINKNSIRLHQAYIAEATRLGFDGFALDASKRLEELKQKR